MRKFLSFLAMVWSAAITSAVVDDPIMLLQQQQVRLSCRPTI